MDEWLKIIRNFRVFCTFSDRLCFLPYYHDNELLKDVFLFCICKFNCSIWTVMMLIYVCWSVPCFLLLLFVGPWNGVPPFWKATLLSGASEWDAYLNLQCRLFFFLLFVSLVVFTKLKTYLPKTFKLGEEFFLVLFCFVNVILTCLLNNYLFEFWCNVFIVFILSCDFWFSFQIFYISYFCFVSWKLGHC